MATKSPTLYLESDYMFESMENKPRLFSAQQIIDFKNKRNSQPSMKLTRVRSLSSQSDGNFMMNNSII